MTRANVFSGRAEAEWRRAYDEIVAFEQNLCEEGTDYERAVRDMLRHTDHKEAPWRLIAAENKPPMRGWRSSKP